MSCHAGTSYDTIEQCNAARDAKNAAETEELFCYRAGSTTCEKQRVKKPASAPSGYKACKMTQAECETEAKNAQEIKCCCTNERPHYKTETSTVGAGCRADCQVIPEGKKCDPNTGPEDPAPLRSSDPLSIKLGRGEDLNPNDLNDLNPLSNSDKEFNTEAGRKPGNIVSRLVRNVVFPASGLLLFLYLVWGGFQVVSGATTGNDNTINAGKQRVTAAIVGFLLLFASYWLWSLVETAMGLGGTTS